MSVVLKVVCLEKEEKQINEKKKERKNIYEKKTVICFVFFIHCIQVYSLYSSDIHVSKRLFRATNLKLDRN